MNSVGTGAFAAKLATGAGATANGPALRNTSGAVATAVMVVDVAMVRVCVVPGAAKAPIAPGCATANRPDPVPKYSPNVRPANATISPSAPAEAA